MSMILSWALFPLVLMAVGLGWGALVDWAAGEREVGALAIPLGLAAAIVVAGIFTMFSFSAPAAAPVVAGGAAVGLARAWGRAKLAPAALVAALGVLLVYGAPVILSGEATFLGYVRLDDTATWLGFTDQFFAHGRSLSALPTSTYALLLSTNLTMAGYPSGAFMLPGVGHWITGIDSAWIFQPYLAVCAAALALCCWELLAPVVKSGWVRAFVAFIAAQSALLFGYAAWGGVKELTAAFLLALGLAVSARLITCARVGPRATVPFAVATAALIVTLGAGAAIYVAPVVLVGIGVFVWRGAPQRSRVVAVIAWEVFAAVNAVLAALAFAIVPTATVAFASPDHRREAAIALLALDFAVLQWMPGVTRSEPLVRRALGLAVVAACAAVIFGAGTGVTPYVALGGLVALCLIAVSSLSAARSFLGGAGAPLFALPLAAILALPSWLTLSASLQADSTFSSVASTSAAATASHATAYGNLISALRAIQLGGIWIDGDFRSYPVAPPSFVNHLLIYGVFAGAIFALGWTLWRRSAGLALYVAVAMISVVALSLLGGVPWVMGKSLAISSPAVLLAGMTGGAILFNLERVLGVIVGVLLLGAIAGGVLWSNYLQYHNVTLAPRARLSEFQTISALIAGKGPTFINEYEIYADRHFLRDAAPVEPAEYRPVNLPTLGNALLTDSAWANIDAFGLSTLEPYRSLVIRIGPTESQPPSIYGRRPVYQGRYYALWQQPARQTVRVIEHEPLGDTLHDAYCGNASPGAPYSPLCPIAPAALPSCTMVRSLASTAAADGGELLAYERPNPIVVRGTDTQWSASGWLSSPQTGTLTAAASGATATAHIVVRHAARDYQLWLGGSFGRGFTVSLDGRPVGSVADALDPPGAYERIGSPLTLQAGTHAITITYPGANLSPGNADSEYYTSLFAIALSPPSSQMHYVEVKPARAQSLCGRSLDWIEVVAPA